MANNQPFKKIPTTDETTEFGTTIFWSQVMIRPNTTDPRHNSRFVPVTCQWGRHRNIDINWLRRSKFGGSCMRCGRDMSDHHGKNHKNWKGGTYIRKDGYRCISEDALTPEQLAIVATMFKSRKYILENSCVMSLALGRPLKD